MYPAISQLRRNFIIIRLLGIGYLVLLGAFSEGFLYISLEFITAAIGVQLYLFLIKNELVVVGRPF